MAGLAAAIVALVAQCIALLVRGRDIPFLPLALSAAVGAIFLIAWIAVLGALTIVMHDVLAMLVSFPGYILTMRLVTSTATAYPAFGEVPWMALAALLVITVLALAFLVFQSREQEFA